MDIGVDPGRLSEEAASLGAQGGGLAQIRSGLDSATGTAINGCGSLPDGGLRAALRNLSDNWGFDVGAIGSDVNGVAGVMSAMARLYAQVDATGAQELGG